MSDLTSVSDSKAIHIAEKYSRWLTRVNSLCTYTVSSRMNSSCLSTIILSLTHGSKSLIFNPPSSFSCISHACIFFPFAMSSRPPPSSISNLIFAWTAQSSPLRASEEQLRSCLSPLRCPFLRFQSCACVRPASRAAAISHPLLHCPDVDLNVVDVVDVDGALASALNPLFLCPSSMKILHQGKEARAVGHLHWKPLMPEYQTY